MPRKCPNAGGDAITSRSEEFELGVRRSKVASDPGQGQRAAVVVGERAARDLAHRIRSRHQGRAPEVGLGSIGFQMNELSRRGAVGFEALEHLLTEITTLRIRNRDRFESSLHRKIIGSHVLSPFGKAGFDPEGLVRSGVECDGARGPQARLDGGGGFRRENEGESFDVA